MRIMILGFLIVAAPAVAAEQQFDLVCTAKKASEHYRIDLDKGEWCFGDCQRIMKIQQVTEGEITLFDETPAPPLNQTIYNRINRITGEWAWYNFSPRLSSVAMDVRGACEKAPYSGMPTAKRRF